MNRRAAVSLLVPLLFGFLPASAAPNLDRLRAATPGRLEVRWSPDGTSLRTIAGRLSAPRAGAPEEVAKVFLEDERELFGLDPDLAGLRLRGARKSPGGSHVGYEQVYQGLPVFDGGLDVHLDASGSVYLVQSAYAAGLDVPTAPRLSAAAATAAALRHFAVAALAATDKRGQPLFPAGTARKARTTGRPELGIFPSESGPVLVYRVELYSAAPLALVEFFVSATDGSIVLSRNLVQSAVDGQGRVFVPNPVVALNDPTLTDHDDADDPSFAAAYVEVTLPQVKRLFSDKLGPYSLMGPYVRIADLIEPPYNMAVTSPDGRFDFGRDAQGFEAVMAYFHIDRNQRYIQSLGFTDVNNRAIAVDPHGVFGMDNSHYVPLPFGAGWVAFGEGGVDDAEDADVLLHEYGHAIQDNSNPGRFLPFRETGAMGEGFGDYWAFSNSPQTGFDPACIAEWDFQGSCLRRVDGTKHYPEDVVGEVHADGEIWSSVLHGVFGALGKEEADRVILESHFLVPPRPGFCDGALALEQAAANLYGNTITSEVSEAAVARGIAGDLTFTPVVGGTTFPPLRFAVKNQGVCAVGSARHAITLVHAGVVTSVGSVTTPDLAPGESMNFEVDVPGAVQNDLIRVLLDADGDVAETNEANNFLQIVVPRPVVGTPPTIASVDVQQQSQDGLCDYTSVLQGLLCTNGIAVEMIAPPFPTITVSVHYTEAVLRATVTDPDSTPAQSDIISVTAVDPAHAISLSLLDDGGVGSPDFGQVGEKLEDCTVDPAAGICSCSRAKYPVSTGDAVAGDDNYAQASAFVRQSGAPVTASGRAILLNCAARSGGHAPQPLPDVEQLNFTILAADNGGNQTAWPQNPAVSLDPASVTCDGDACACCLLMSDSPTSPAASGGCSGLAGLAGVPGSGFENGFCKTFF
jgi:Zn-dependent metalloprotease